MTSESLSAPRRQLSPDQQALAARFIPLARRLALSWKRKLHNGWEEFESAALFALVQAAASYDPARGVKFATYARHRIDGALRDARRDLVVQARMHGASDLDIDKAPSVIERSAQVIGIEPTPPVGWEIESLDAINGWLGKLPARHAAACRQIYLLGKSQLEAARAIGMSQSRLCAVHQDALEMLGKPRTPGTDGASSASRPRHLSKKRVSDSRGPDES
jgi:RNA polymerase sigma factor (sigma-70 family)